MHTPLFTCMRPQLWALASTFIFLKKQIAFSSRWIGGVLELWQHPHNPHCQNSEHILHWFAECTLK